KLSKDEQLAKSKEMDRVWKAAESNPAELLPCLRAALEDPGANPWFQFDGSALLVKLDPSRESKALQVRMWANADFDDVDLRTWVQTLAFRGYEGFDVSAAGARWLANPRLKYYVPEHALEVDSHYGSIFLFGSMDEAMARPKLIEMAKDRKHP